MGRLRVRVKFPLDSESAALKALCVLEALLAHYPYATANKKFNDFVEKILENGDMVSISVLATFLRIVTDSSNIFAAVDWDKCMFKSSVNSSGTISVH